MRELEKDFMGHGSTAGFRFIQIFRSERAYIYKVIDPFGFVTYDVFRHRESPDKDIVLKGVPIHYDACVRYPSANEFGIWAKCCCSMNRAFDWFREYSKIEGYD